MKVEFRTGPEERVKGPDNYWKEPAARVNLALLQPSGFVQGLAGTKHRFRNIKEREETVVEVLADTNPTKDAIELDTYINDAKLALRQS